MIRANEASSTDIIIPVGDAYHSLIANSVVDATHFSSADAKPAEQAVYAAFQAKKTDTLAQIMADMQSSTTAPYNQLSEEMQDYMDYIVDDVLKDYTGLLMTDKIDTSDETYTAWTRDETINVYNFPELCDHPELDRYIKAGERFLFQLGGDLC